MLFWWMVISISWYMRAVSRYKTKLNLIDSNDCAFLFWTWIATGILVWDESKFALEFHISHSDAAEATLSPTGSCQSVSESKLTAFLFSTPLYNSFFYSSCLQCVCTLSSRLLSGFRSPFGPLVLFKEIGVRNLKANVDMKGGKIEEIVGDT